VPPVAPHRSFVPTLLTLNNYHYRRGGADVAYLEQSELFMRNGWEVASFSMMHEKNIASPWDRFFVQEIEFGHTYSRLRLLENAVKSIYSFEAASKVRALIRRMRPDIAHAHNVYHHLSPSVLRAVKEEGIPVFLTLHDVKILCPARTMWRHGMVCEDCRGGRIHNVVRHKCMKDSLALSSLMFLESGAHRLLGLYKNNVDKFISPSLFVMKKFVEWGWPEDRFVHIRNFVDAATYVPSYRPGRAFLYFGRLSGEKGVSALVRAAAMARVSLWIVGTGPELQALKVLAESLHADVTFFGYKTGEALWDLVRGARAVVLPSEWYENAPLSILEAFALGKPAIGARIGGMPEMIRDGVTGRLFESGNVQDLAQTLVSVAEKPDSTIEEWGRQAQHLAVTEYSPIGHYERLVELYAKYGLGLPLRGLKNT
jgi:glycosyltransferase involved in cell wall biosynthesis